MASKKIIVLLALGVDIKKVDKDVVDGLKSAQLDSPPALPPAADFSEAVWHHTPRWRTDSTVRSSCTLRNVHN